MVLERFQGPTLIQQPLDFIPPDIRQQIEAGRLDVIPDDGQASVIEALYQYVRLQGVNFGVMQSFDLFSAARKCVAAKLTGGIVNGSFLQYETTLASLDGTINNLKREAADVLFLMPPIMLSGTLAHRPEAALNYSAITNLQKIYDSCAHDICAAQNVLLGELSRKLGTTSVNVTSDLLRPSDVEEDIRKREFKKEAKRRLRTIEVTLLAAAGYYPGWLLESGEQIETGYLDDDQYMRDHLLGLEGLRRRIDSHKVALFDDLGQEQVRALLQYDL